MSEVTFSFLCPLFEKYGTCIEGNNALIEKVSPCSGAAMAGFDQYMQASNSEAKENSLRAAIDESRTGPRSAALEQEREEIQVAQTNHFLILILILILILFLFFFKQKPPWGFVHTICAHGHKIPAPESVSFSKIPARPPVVDCPSR
eukprot:SAG31_NODE_548_length_14222_cov_10.926574_12_plen_147_part_00